MQKKMIRHKERHFRKKLAERISIIFLVCEKSLRKKQKISAG